MREGNGWSDSDSENDDDYMFPNHNIRRTFSPQISTSIIEREQEEELDEEEEEAEVEEDAQSEEEAEGEQDHHQSEEEVEEDQQSEEEEDQEDDDMNADEEPNNQPSNSQDKEGHGSISAIREDSNIVITLTDPGLLDCPICFEPLTVPVFQCDQNGHIACSSCCTKIKNKCPSCSCLIGSNRCRAIEKVVESSTTPCQNIKYGCNTQVTYNKKNEHENTCVCSPCSCPYIGCNFVSSTKELYQHFSNNHLDSATGFMYDVFDLDSFLRITLKKNDSIFVILQRHSGTLFILHNRVEVLGNVVMVSCIQPSFMEGFNYDILVSKKQSSLKFQSVTKSTPSLQINGLPSTSFLLIPCDFFDSCGQVKIDVTIQRKG